MARKASAGRPAGGRSRLGLSRIYYGYWLIGASFIAQFVAVGSQNYVVGTFFKPMTEDLGWTRSGYTIARTLGQLVMAVTGFLIGAQVDKHGARRFMMAGVAVLSSALLLLGSVQTLWQWILLNGLILTAGSAMIGNLVVNTTLAKWFVEKRGLAISLGAMGISFAGVALVPLATFLIDTFGWRVTWRLLAAGTAALILPLAFVMRRAPEDHGLYPDGRTADEVAAGAGAAAIADLGNSMTRREALRTLSFYMLVVAFGLFGVTIGVMLLQTIPFMTDEGYGRGLAALMITLTSIPALVSKPIWGFFIDRTDARRLAAGSSALTGLAMLIITLSVPVHHDLIVYGGFFLLGWRVGRDVTSPGGHLGIVLRASPYRCRAERRPAVRAFPGRRRTVARELLLRQGRRLPRSLPRDRRAERSRSADVALHPPPEATAIAHQGRGLTRGGFLSPHPGRARSRARRRRGSAREARAISSRRSLRPRVPAAVSRLP